MESVHDAIKAGGQLIGMNPAPPQPPEDNAAKFQKAADRDSKGRPKMFGMMAGGGLTDLGRRRHHHCQPGTEESC